MVSTTAGVIPLLYPQSRSLSWGIQFRADDGTTQCQLINLRTPPRSVCLLIGLLLYHGLKIFHLFQPAPLPPHGHHPSSSSSPPLEALLLQHSFCVPSLQAPFLSFSPPNPDTLPIHFPRSHPNSVPPQLGTRLCGLAIQGPGQWGPNVCLRLPFPLWPRWAN